MGADKMRYALTALAAIVFIVAVLATGASIAHQVGLGATAISRGMRDPPPLVKKEDRLAPGRRHENYPSKLVRTQSVPAVNVPTNPFFQPKDPRPVRSAPIRGAQAQSQLMIYDPDQFRRIPNAAPKNHR